MAENKKNKRKFDDAVNKLAETETETVDNPFNDESGGKKKSTR